MFYKLRFLRNLVVKTEKLRSLTISSVNLSQKISFNFKRDVGAKFQWGENDFSHEILQGFPKYSVVRPQKIEILESEPVDVEKIQWKELGTDEFCDLFKRLSYEAHLKNFKLEDAKFTELCKAFEEQSEKLSDEQLENVLRSLSFWPFVKKPRNKNYYNLWSSLDSRCLERWKNWEYDKILLFIDLWFSVRLTRQSNFVFLAVNKLAKKPQRLDSHQVVQLLFYLNIMRTISKNVAMYEIEHKISQIVEELTLTELGIAAMGFFKTKHNFHNTDLMANIMDRIVKEADSIPSVTLACLLKILRNSMQPSLWERLPPLLDSLERQVDRLPMLSCSHIILVVTSSQFFHRGAMTKVAQKLVENIRDSRLKDMEKVIYSLTLLSFDPETYPCIYKTVTAELLDPAREQELADYPKTLIAVLHYLCLRGIFVEPLIARVLQEEFLVKTYGKNPYTFSREVLYIDTSVGLECPTYTGPRLSEKSRIYLSKRHSQYIPEQRENNSKHAVYFLNVVDALDMLIQKENFTFKYLLPNHPRADIVFRLDSRGNVLELPDDFKAIPDFSDPIKAPDNTFHAMVVGSRNMFACNANVRTGETNSKLRQLKLIGYKPILVSYYEWEWSNTTQKLALLQKLVFG